MSNAGPLFRPFVATWMRVSAQCTTGFRHINILHLMCFDTVVFSYTFHVGVICILLNDKTRRQRFPAADIK